MSGTRGTTGTLRPRTRCGPAGRAMLRGFTLLEMITVCFLLALVLSAIFATFRVGMRSMEIAEERTQLYQTGRLVMGQLHRELSSLWVSAPPPDSATSTVLGADETAMDTTSGDETEATPPIKGTNANTSSGASSQLEFTCCVPPFLEDTGPQVSVAHLSYYVDVDPSTTEKGLVRAENRYFDLGDAEKTTTVTALAEEVTDFDVKYYDPDEATWVDEWDATTLPTAVLFSLMIDDPEDGEDAITLTHTVTLPRKLGATIGEALQEETPVEGDTMTPTDGEGMPTGTVMPTGGGGR